MALSVKLPEIGFNLKKKNHQLDSDEEVTAIGIVEAEERKPKEDHILQMDAR